MKNIPTNPFLITGYQDPTISVTAKMLSVK